MKLLRSTKHGLRSSGECLKDQRVFEKTEVDIALQWSMFGVSVDSLPIFEYLLWPDLRELMAHFSTMAW